MGRPSPLEDNVHRAILQVLEDTSYLSLLNLDEVCKVEPKYIEFFGLPSSTGHRRQVGFQKSNYKRKRRDNPKNYAAACFKFGVEVDQAVHPLVFEWIQVFKEDRDQATEEAKTMTTPRKVRTPNPPSRRDNDDDDDDDDDVGFGDSIFEGKKNLI
jgi:hypothetical protein